MKRFILCSFNGYYPSGGFNDFEGSFDTLIDAATFVLERTEKYDEDELVDFETGKQYWFNHITKTWDELGSVKR